MTDQNWMKRFKNASIYRLYYHHLKHWIAYRAYLGIFCNCQNTIKYDNNLMLLPRLASPQPTKRLKYSSVIDALQQ